MTSTSSCWRLRRRHRASKLGAPVSGIKRRADGVCRRPSLPASSRMQPPGPQNAQVAAGSHADYGIGIDAHDPLPVRRSSPARLPSSRASRSGRRRSTSCRRRWRTRLHRECRPPRAQGHRRVRRRLFLMTDQGDSPVDQGAAAGCRHREGGSRQMTTFPRPERSGSAEHYFNHIDQVPSGDIRGTGGAGGRPSSSPEDPEDSQPAYAPDKWTIRRASHINDTERCSPRALVCAACRNRCRASTRTSRRRAEADDRTGQPPEEFKAIRASTPRF